ncbi:hypothetical protein L0156_27970 [bacterium]|nr:hypothetical protein [bacterium]
MQSLFPDDPNVYDSSGDASLVKGDRKEAIRYYQKPLEIDPFKTSALEILRHLEGTN